MSNVTPLGRGPPRDPPDDRWLRRQALNLAAQLPDDIDDALRIIQHLETLVRTFLDNAPPT